MYKQRLSCGGDFNQLWPGYDILGVSLDNAQTEE